VRIESTAPHRSVERQQLGRSGLVEEDQHGVIFRQLVRLPETVVCYRADVAVLRRAEQPRGAGIVW
jgi:hypothetical protein